MRTGRCHRRVGPVVVARSRVGEFLFERKDPLIFCGGTRAAEIPHAVEVARNLPERGRVAGEGPGRGIREASCRGARVHPGEVALDDSPHEGAEAFLDRKGPIADGRRGDRGTSKGFEIASIVVFEQGLGLPASAAKARQPEDEEGDDEETDDERDDDQREDRSGQA